MAFVPAYREGGGVCVPRPYYIAAATAIERGEVVLFTPGTGIAAVAGTDFDDPAIGVAAEAHDGSTAGRQSGTEILIFDDPAYVFKVVPRTESTTTGGDATSWIDSSLTAANDIFNGGHIVITDTNNVAGFAVGDVLTITDFANSGGDCTVTGAGGTIASGMKGYIYPDKRAAGNFAFDLNSDGTNIDLDTAGGEALYIEDVKWDEWKKQATVYVKLRLHQKGNHVVAL
jgi:hypothetical protein